MKKISCFSTIFLTILLQNIAVTSASAAEMSNDDFNQLVCESIRQIGNKSEALDQIKAMSESKINQTQLAKLEEIAKSEPATRDFCRASLPRL